MPEEVTISDEGKFIHVKSYGEITDEDFRNTLDAIQKIRQDQGLTKVLVDGSEVTSYQLLQLLKQEKGQTFLSILQQNVDSQLRSLTHWMLHYRG
jgi:hypothetical protein